MGRIYVTYLSLNATAVAQDHSIQPALSGESSDNDDDDEQNGQEPVIEALMQEGSNNSASTVPRAPSNHREQSNYVCASCGTHLAKYSDLISREFRGRSGQASLFHSTVNTTESLPEDRMLITGKHTICDLFCVSVRVFASHFLDLPKLKEQKN